MTRSLFAASAIVAFCMAGAAAQTGSPGTGNPASKSPAAPQAAPRVPAANQPDHMFVRQATLGGNAEVALGKLAAQKGSSDAVKSFGDHMVRDHGKANDQLTAIAKEANIPQPQGVDAAHKDAHDRLSKMSGASFDRAYMAGQVADHQQTAQLLQHEISAGQDEALKRFATDTLPVVMRHLEMAQDIQRQLGQGRPTASGSPQSRTSTGGHAAQRGDASAAERKRTEELNLQQLQKQ